MTGNNRDALLIERTRLKIWRKVNKNLKFQNCSQEQHSTIQKKREKILKRGTNRPQIHHRGHSDTDRDPNSHRFINPGHTQRS